MITTHPSPLNLLAYYVEHYSCKVTLENIHYFDPDNAFVSCDTAHFVSEDDMRHKIDLTISVKSKRGKKFPYNINLSISGVFEIEPDDLERLGGYLVDINGGSVLYGAAREYIMTSTSRCPCGPYMLPTIAFKPDPEKAADAERIHTE